MSAERERPAAASETLAGECCGSPPIRLRLLRSADADWSVCAEIRRRVFVDEQGVPEALELDGLDSECVHFIACVGAHALGTARLRELSGPDERQAKAERVAVLASVRGLGVGRALMDALESEALRRGCAVLTLSSQLTAVPFYRRLGYESLGDVYLEAGIEHLRMRKRL